MRRTSEQVEAIATPTTPVIRTFLIADVRGYTMFTNEQGVPAAARLADRFANLCQATVSQRDGKVIELRGDEALCVFSSPRATLLAAVDLQRRFREEMESDPTLPLRVGIGIDVGEVVPIQGGYRGKALNLAARLCSLAGPSEVFSSEQVVQQAERIEGLAYVERGQVQLKGFPDPIRVIHVLPQEDLPENFPPLVSLIAKPSNLPLQTTPFIGRDREVGEVANLLRQEEVRLLTLTGVGGTGKTRLALQVGAAVLDEFERGVFFVDLAPLADPDLVAATIASTLKVKEVAGKDILATLIEYLQDRQMLLVLDNFEHLLDAARVVYEVVISCPRLTLLVTSREVLHLSAEHEYQVPPLAVPDPRHPPDLETLSQYEAVALFIERARAVKPGFAVSNENAPAVAEICYRLDGLPLAIELAAARIKHFPPPALLQRLSSRLQLLTSGARDRPSRQQTLRNTIDWSYNMLTGREQLLFARLSVFAGGCTFEAAEAVCSPGGDLDLLEGMPSLVDKSLLRQEGEEEPRFVMLETLREYAAEKLAERGEEEQIREAHAQYFLTYAQQTEPEDQDRHFRSWLKQVDADLDNFRRGTERLLGSRRNEEGLLLVCALQQLWHNRGYGSEFMRWIQRGLEDRDGVTPKTRAEALRHLSGQVAGLGDVGRGTRLAEEAMAIYEELGDRKGRAKVLIALSQLAYAQHDYARALRSIDEALAVYRELRDSTGITRGLWGVGTCASAQGDYAMAERYLAEALDLARSQQSPLRTTAILINLGNVAVKRGQLDQAEERLEEARVIAEDVGWKNNLAFARFNLGGVALMHADYGRAEEHLRAAIRLGGELQQGQVTIPALLSLVQLAVATGELARGARLAGAVEVHRVGFDGLLSLPELERYQRALGTLRSGLDTETMDRMWRQGEGMSMEEAVAYALEERA